MVSCGSQAMRAPSADFQPDVGPRLARTRAIELFAGLRRHGHGRPLRRLDLPGDAIAAGQAAGRVDQDGLQRIALGPRACGSWRRPPGRGARCGCGPRCAARQAWPAHRRVAPKAPSPRSPSSASGHPLPASSARRPVLSRTYLIASRRPASYRVRVQGAQRGVPGEKRRRDAGNHALGGKMTLEGRDG